MAIEDKPECYGQLDLAEDECQECEIAEECARYTGRLNSRTAGLSRSRAMKALCWECNAGTSYGPDCRGPVCPIYAFRKNNKGEPNLWWALPAKEWSEAHAKARAKVVKMKESS